MLLPPKDSFIIYKCYRKLFWEFKAGFRLVSVLADSDLKQNSGDNILVSIPVYHLSVIRYFLPVEIVFKKRMPISTDE